MNAIRNISRLSSTTNLIKRTLQTKVALVVFPTPGGPDKSAALKLAPVGSPPPQGVTLGLGFFLPDSVLLLACQFWSHFINFWTLLFAPCWPMICFIDVGLYLSTHIIWDAPLAWFSPVSFETAWLAVDSSALNSLLTENRESCFPPSFKRFLQQHFAAVHSPFAI